MIGKWFNDFRWDALGARLALVGSAMHGIIVYVPAQYKPWGLLAIAIVGLIESFIRNPKDLEWVTKTDDDVESVPRANGLTLEKKRKSAELRKQLEDLEESA